MEKKTTMELVETITNFVNNFNCDKEGFKTAFRRQHRTLQQSTIRLFLEVMEDVAKDDFHTDLRNQDSKEVCKDLIEGFRIVKERKTGYPQDGYFPSQFLGSI